MHCKKCQSPELVKSGRTKYGTQLYRCLVCDYHGTMTGGKTIKGKSQPPCSICGDTGYSKGLCKKHYHQQRYQQLKNK